jgi:hypothetical protein
MCAENLCLCLAAVDWNHLLPKDSIMKLKYTLGIVRSNVIAPALPPLPVVEGGAPDPVEKARQDALMASYTKWSEMFLTKGGFNHLANIIFASKPAEMLANPQTQECLFHLLELLNYFIGSPHLSSTFCAILYPRFSVRFQFARH